MNDCRNADIRDQLPDLVHERLEVRARAAVVAHVDGCADCRAELELLQSMRGVLVASTPKVDISYIVQALPKPAPQTATTLTASTASIPSTAPNGVRFAPPRRTWGDWRIAAAVTLFVVGGSSVAVLHRNGTQPPVGLVDTAAIPAPASASSVPATTEAPTAAPSAVASSTARMSTTAASAAKPGDHSAAVTPPRAADESRSAATSRPSQTAVQDPSSAPGSRRRHSRCRR